MTRKPLQADAEAKRQAFNALRPSVERPGADPQAAVEVRVPDPADCALQEEARQVEYRRAYERAVRCLAAREHSERELLNKLRTREIDADLARRVLEDLKAQNLQSDERFAESLVRSRINRGQGPIRIRQELGRKGVADELQEEVLTHAGDFWVGVACRARDKRFGSSLPEDRNDWNRQARFLAGRGFPSDIIYRVLGNLG